MFAGLIVAGCSSDDAKEAQISSDSSINSGTDNNTIPKVNENDGTLHSSGGYRSAITDEVIENPVFDRLGSIITDRISKADVPGASLLILQDGKMVHQAAYGSYDLSRVVPIASASKWLSGAVIMTFVEDGLIDLDKPISTYLADAKGKPSGAITMRQLVSFTSGLKDDDQIPCFGDVSITLSACNSTILGLPLIDKPGVGFRYGGTHLHVAAGVVEAVAGKSFEQVFQERVAGPLKMTNTTFTPPYRKATATDGHPSPAGSAASSLGDYGRFMEMLVHEGMAPSGTRILEAASIREMSKDQTGDAKFVSASRHRKKAATLYGVAHWLDVVDANEVGLVQSSPGAFGFRPWIDSVNGIAGVYLIWDTDESHVEDSPNREAGPVKVHTSGNFILVESAKALGGKVPAAQR